MQFITQQTFDFTLKTLKHLIDADMNTSATTNKSQQYLMS